MPLTFLVPVRELGLPGLVVRAVLATLVFPDRDADAPYSDFQCRLRFCLGLFALVAFVMLVFLLFWDRLIAVP